ncbi:citrate/2-methylcitrate synthase [Treponema porcinum]|uniref:citrate/2-methylcitrate synthase n=1 Tax=Treponema porcinum TaxID=261392 RepID=UPI002355385B|nr:citrate/2-methylcitrate synthase [Treponema porcinum]MCI6481239.1 citrate/2-methylcitrate synthase [Treponema porcinum]MDD7126203.1 citrate/2-methylcitrate synthase [Treponema porcinum]MDY5454405.1 citrate/2-methylcitrate synthase [Treponema porcinum]
MNSKITDKMIEKLSSRAVLNDPINPDLYEKYDVKRGLRNANGTGVLVGLTRIGDVVGYEIGANGEKIPVPGRLMYRGYDVIDLVKDAESHDDYCYEQCAYLLLMGELPTKDELQRFRDFLGSVRSLPPNFTEDMIMKAPSQDIMNKLARGVLASYSYDENPEDRSVPNIMRQCIELISRFSTLAAYGYQARRRYYENQSMFIHNPISTLSTAENFLHLIRPDGKYTKLEAQVLDLALIIHAEHGGGNNSSLTVHVVSSADTDTYSAIAAAVGSLKGRRHGGANIRVVEMMDEIKKNVKDWSSEKEIRDYLYKIAKKQAFDKTGLIYGMGHAVYTISDPRALLLREKAKQLAEEKGCLEEFNLYRTIEQVAPEILMEVHHSDKRICANVDLYSGFVYSMLNIPRELFTPIFAISRIAGWSAHRIEEIVAGGRIYRPAYKNVCEERKYIPIDDRK